MENDWKKRLGVVYSTNPEYNFDKGEVGREETLPPEKQSLRVFIERKGRKGKTVTIVTGFIGTDKDLQVLARDAKKHCGSGGSVKDGEIIIQGDNQVRITSYLELKHYNVRKGRG